MKTWMLLVITAAMWLMFMIGYALACDVVDKKMRTAIEAARAEDLEMCRNTVLKIERQLAKECMEWCESRAVFAPDDAVVSK